MDYNVIYLDDDERNARPLVQDGRRPAPGWNHPLMGGKGMRPATGIVVPPSNRPTVIQGAGATRPYYPAPAPYYPAPQPTVVYHQPSGMPSVLGNMTSSDLVELGLQVLAALRPLPAAPTALGDVETDVNNMVIYQTALAEFAQNDERLRTLGNVLGRILRK
jgi:hypothetical protein